ncbi:MAG: hypothetical protein J7J34_02395 [Thermoplasmata archaeon]|nr:hypothetical protein [Thermoplasmata archaeon]
MKKMAILLAFLMMLPVATAADFELEVNDAQGDVSNADMDVVQAWTTVEGNNLVFHMKVAGNINNAYSYSFELNDGSTDVGAVYSNGIGYYSGLSSAGQATAKINGNTLTLEVPYNAVSSLNASTLQFRAFAGDATTNTWDYTSFVGGGGGGGGNGDNGVDALNDPTKGGATDGSIDVAITDVDYSLNKENADYISGSIMVKGTTNGVDHVSLCFVVYYKNGTYDYGSWIVGPSEFHHSLGGYSINEFFNSTEGNWNKWEFNMSGTYPISNYNWAYDMLKGESEVSKVVVYARAFKDKEETKWNQASYETVPSFSADKVSYGTDLGGGENGENEENNGGEKSKTPGFEFAITAAAIISLVLIEKRRR